MSNVVSCDALKGLVLDILSGLSDDEKTLVRDGVGVPQLTDCSTNSPLSGTIAITKCEDNSSVTSGTLKRSNNKWVISLTQNSADTISIDITSAITSAINEAASKDWRLTAVSYTNTVNADGSLKDVKARHTVTNDANERNVIESDLKPLVTTIQSALTRTIENTIVDRVADKYKDDIVDEVIGAIGTTGGGVSEEQLVALINKEILKQINNMPKRGTAVRSLQGSLLGYLVK